MDGFRAVTREQWLSSVDHYDAYTDEKSWGGRSLELFYFMTHRVHSTVLFKGGLPNTYFLSDRLMESPHDKRRGALSSEVSLPRFHY